MNIDRAPGDGKLSRPVWGRGKSCDNIKGLPIAIDSARPSVPALTPRVLLRSRLTRARLRPVQLQHKRRAAHFGLTEP